MSRIKCFHRLLATVTPNIPSKLNPVSVHQTSNSQYKKMFVSQFIVVSVIIIHVLTLQSIISSTIDPDHCAYQQCIINSNVNKNYENEKKRGHSIMSSPRHLKGDLLENRSFNTISSTINLNEQDPNVMRESILNYFYDSFDLFTSLHSTVKNEYFWTRGDPLRHPVGWYVGHTAAFYINKLRLAGIIDAPINRYYESLFAVGVDEQSWDDKLQDRYDWPDVNKVYQYRQEIRQFVANTIQVEFIL